MMKPVKSTCHHVAPVLVTPGTGGIPVGAVAVWLKYAA